MRRRPQFSAMQQVPAPLAAAVPLRLPFLPFRRWPPLEAAAFELKMLDISGKLWHNIENLE
jgi:hypothetical protein